MAGTKTGPRYPGANALVISVAVFALFLFAPRVLADGDTFWHIRAGEWILSNGRVPHEDPFAYTTQGLTWVPHEWLAEVLLALAWTAAGWSGVVILCGAAGALAFWVMARALERWVPSLSAYALLLLTLMALMPGLLARPHVLALPVMVSWTVLLVRAREEHRTPPGWAPMLMCAWANLHGGFLAGLVLAGALAVEAVWQAGFRREVVLSWTGFLGFSVVMTLATPLGPAGLLFPLHMMAQTQKAGIQEWAAPDFSGFEPLEVILLAALFVGLTGRVRLPWFRVLLLLGLVHGALQHARLQLQLAVFGFLLAAPFLAMPSGRAVPAVRASTGPRCRRDGLVLIVLMLALAGGRLAMPLERAEDRMAPRSALASVPAEVRATPVLNAYQYGGFLIFNDVPVFIDSRADLYGDRRLEEYAAIAVGQDTAVEKALAGWKIGWVIAPPGSALAGWFEGRAGWRRIYEDGFAVVFARG